MIFSQWVRRAGGGGEGFKQIQGGQKCNIEQVVFLIENLSPSIPLYHVFFLTPIRHLILSLLITSSLYLGGKPSHCEILSFSCHMCSSLYSSKQCSGDHKCSSSTIEGTTTVMQLMLARSTLAQNGIPIRIRSPFSLRSVIHASKLDRASIARRT